MRRGWLLLALFCILTLSACGGTGDLITNPLACRPNGVRPESSLSTCLGRLGQTQVDKQKGDVSITILSDSLFQPGPRGLELANQTDIGVLADACKKYPHMKVAVDAYTDCIHSEEQNLTLSQLEALLVKQALIHSGVPAKRISAQGWGESKPVATNATEDGRKSNRRVTITFGRSNS